MIGGARHQESPFSPHKVTGANLLPSPHPTAPMDSSWKGKSLSKAGNSRGVLKGGLVQPFPAPV